MGEPAEVPTPDAANSGIPPEDGPVTRRGVLSASALLAAATVVVGGGTNAAEALASTTKTSPTASSGKGVTITVNGKKHTSQAAPDTPLLYILRDELYLRGPKFGCGLSECGACAVLLNGKQIRSCIWPLNKVGTDSVVTLDGLAASYHGEKAAKKGAMHPLQKAWIENQVPQCGYCQSGMMIQAADLLAKNPNPTTAEIKTAMNGHICRCGTYNNIIAGIHAAAKEMQK
jgi:aerobic-type carbon monoxide dehydrogenase small subunit (CoxS/CutS family)